ncbi:hypothetical protein F5Y18DRAFT_431868 [Xylariaceae sp. FL1019]|nr:hypothetical protein F5Y18DRAFT_431868 [Xylariaceae sp. FL1019]
MQSTTPQNATYSIIDSALSVSSTRWAYCTIDPRRPPCNCPPRGLVTWGADAVPALTWSDESNIHNACHDVYTEFLGMMTLLFMPKEVFQKWKRGEGIEPRLWPGLSIEDRYKQMKSNEERFLNHVQQSKDVHTNYKHNNHDERVENRQPPRYDLEEQERKRIKEEKEKEKAKEEELKEEKEKEKAKEEELKKEKEKEKYGEGYW